MKTLFLALAAAAGLAIGQQVPPCVVNFNFTAAAQTTGTAGCLNNSTGLVDFRMVYKVNGFNPVSLVVESAPDNNGVPGAWVTFVGTTVEGPNPATSTTSGTVRVTGFNPWVRVRAATLTGAGSVQGVIYGCPSPGCSMLGAAGAIPAILSGTTAAGADAVANLWAFVVGTAPLAVMPTAFNGATWNREFVCPLRTAFNLAAGTDVVIAAGVASTNIRLCHVSFSSDTSAAVTMRQGTGATCATNTVALTGAYQGVSSFAMDYSNASPIVTSAAASDVCLHFGTSVTTGGVALYAQF